MTFYLFLFLTLHFTTSFAAEDWCYASQANSNSACKGPSEWEKEYATCGQSKQSPINIITCNAEFDSKLTPFKFEGYDKEKNLTLKNNGHTAELNLEGQGTIAISGGGLSGRYEATQLHFHWGSKDNPGSEHSLNGEKYPIELHIVHKKIADRSGSSDKSTASGDLAVLGFFYEEGLFNGNYDNLIKGFTNISNKDTNITIPKVKLQDLIPKDLTLFYRYEGSLTTPACNETVTWTVFPQSIKLHEDQIKAFYTNLKYNDNTMLTENFRPLQKRNNRTIFTSGVDALLPHTGYSLISMFVFYLTLIS